MQLHAHIYLLKVDDAISSDTVCKLVPLLVAFHPILLTDSSGMEWIRMTKNAQVLALNLDENLGISCGMRLPHLPGVLELRHGRGTRPGIIHCSCKSNAAVGLRMHNYCSCM